MNKKYTKIFSILILMFMLIISMNSCMVSINTNIGSDNEMNKDLKTKDFTMDQESGQTMTAEGNR